jgi:3-deoxy-7-phosphoheptulonate synthase
MFGNMVAFVPGSPCRLPTQKSKRHLLCQSARVSQPRAVVDQPPTTERTRQLWTRSSWRDCPVKQQPSYPDQGHLERVEHQLSRMPALVDPEEMRDLKKELASVCNGRGIVLQGGDCAESLDETAAGVTDTVRTLFKMAMVLLWGSFEPVVKIGRLGGQYAKPRSSDMESRNGTELPSYRGEIINGADFTADARIPDPDRMIRAYNHSAGTTNLVRALASGGFADLSKVRAWGMDWASSTEKGREYLSIAESIGDAIRFLEACGVSEESPVLQSTRVYTSHEGLLLPYEEALTRMDPQTGEFFACSGHFIWIGERTRQLDGAHVEYARGISNPIAVKAGPTMDTSELLRLCDVLNPNNEPGRLTIITRMGADKIADGLPPLLRAVKREGRNVVWVTDSMHGNTFTSASGYKTRSWESVMQEVQGFYDAHRAEGTRAGGVHFEMTGAEVTECVGGLNDITSADLSRRYESLCDPRLNSTQSLELAFNIARILRERVTAE